MINVFQALFPYSWGEKEVKLPTSIVIKQGQQVELCRKNTINLESQSLFTCITTNLEPLMERPLVSIVLVLLGGRTMVPIFPVGMLNSAPSEIRKNLFKKTPASVRQREWKDMNDERCE